MVQDLPVALFHLLESMGCIKRSDGHITAIDLKAKNINKVNPLSKQVEQWRYSLQGYWCVRNGPTYNSESLFVRIDFPDGVVASSLFFPRGTSPDTSRAESGTWPVGR